MRAREGALLLICAGVALLVAPGLAAAKSQGLVLTSFKLEASHGYEIEVFSGQGARFPSTVAIKASRDGLSASYQVPDELGAGMNAAFGSVGRIAVDFHRQKRRVSQPEKGCTLIDETGVFRGEFVFAGEGGYTAAEATSVPGEVSRLPNGFCGFGDDRVNLGVPDLLRESHLTARSRNASGIVAFDASAPHIDDELGFEAQLSERLGAMKVTRSASARTEGGADDLNHAGPSHSVLLEPPPPFVGAARFRDPDNGPPTWIGSLGVALPGTSTIALAGPAFAAKLCPNLFLGRQCRAPLP